MVSATTSFRGPVRTIVIANISEFYRPVFGQFHDREIAVWTAPSRAECDMALFWSGDDKLVITPGPIDSAFVSDVRNVLGYHNLQLVSPSKTSESLSTDIQSDSEFFALLVQVLRDSNKPQIIGWGATGPFYALVHRLEQEGVEFATPEVPAANDYWTVPYLDSKCGFREVCARLSNRAPDIRTPLGYVCADLEIASRIVESGCFESSGVVVKANNGVGGYGTLLYRPERFRTSFDIGAHLRLSARFMPIYTNGTVIVEAYIESGGRTEIASPSIQGLVDATGKVSVTCLAGQIVDCTGRYVGAIIGQGIFPSSVMESLRCIGNLVGEEAASIGYRGVFNVDTVLGQDGLLYCLELNARRTSVTYILDLATHLFGAAFSSSVAIISSERYPTKQLSRYSYADLSSLLGRLRFPMNGKPQGVIVTVFSSLAHFAHAPQLGFVVVGEDIAAARTIYAETCQLLRYGVAGDGQL